MKNTYQGCCKGMDRAMSETPVHFIAFQSSGCHIRQVDSHTFLHGGQKDRRAKSLVSTSARVWILAGDSLGRAYDAVTSQGCLN